MAEEVEIISPEEARAILENAIAERVGEHWRRDDDGWAVVAENDYMARLTKNRTNLDFYIDLLGNVTIEEKEITLGQEYGRLIAWVFIGLSLVIAYLVANIAGFL